jgi:5-methyltetrahydropteroyltriglutamate--homocysteine methyltransferase
VAKDLRALIWKQMSEVGVTLIPNNTFSYYDHVPDTMAMVGAMPSCCNWIGRDIHHNVYFSMARGIVSKLAMEMTKWLDSPCGIYIFIRNWHAKHPTWKLTPRNRET